MKSQRGAALFLTIVVLLFAFGLPLILKLLEVTTVKANINAATLRKLTSVDAALLAYVVTNKRLPCPADGSLASGALHAGVEARSGSGDCTSQTSGVVPWVTLGLNETDVTDGWYARMTYRVSDGATGVTRDGALDATACDPAGTSALALLPSGVKGCDPACTHSAAALASCTNSSSYLAGRGLLVVDEAGNRMRNPAASTGAAYVVISPMAEGGGGYNSSGQLLTGSIPAGTDGEVRNMNNQLLPPTTGYFHDSRMLPGDGAGTAHFDDILSHPSIADLISRAQLGARNY